MTNLTPKTACLERFPTAERLKMPSESNPMPTLHRPGITPPSFNLDAKREKMFQQIAEDGPSCLKVFKKAYSGNRPAAVKALCLECCWLDRAAIRECTATECPLWEIRPFQTIKNVVI